MTTRSDRVCLNKFSLVQPNGNADNTPPITRRRRRYFHLQTKQNATQRNVRKDTSKTKRIKTCKWKETERVRTGFITMQLLAAAAATTVNEPDAIQISKANLS